MLVLRRILIAFALVVPAQLTAQWAQVTITSPPNGETVSSPNITITFDGCSSVTPTDYGVYVNNVYKSTSYVTGGCYDWSVRRRYSASATLNSGSNTIRA